MLFENKLIYEINYANKHLSKKDAFKIFINSFNNTCKDIGKHKIRGVRNTHKILKKMFKKGNAIKTYLLISKIKNYKNDKVFQSEIKYFLMYIMQLPKIALIKIGNNTIKFLFIKSNEQKYMILRDILYWGVFLIVAKLAGGGGDLDFEGGIPDMDLNFGIGFHRNFLFHSLIATLGAEFTIRFAMNIYKIFYNELPENHLKLWDNIKSFITLVEESTVSAIWLGTGIHFLVDSNILQGLNKSIKPIVGLPSMSMEMHKAFLLANSITGITVSSSIIDNDIYKGSRN